MGVLADRLERLENLNGELAHRIDAVRQDAVRSVDEKFMLVSQTLARFSDDMAQTCIAVPDYEPFFREELGEACWDWIGVEVQRVFITARICTGTKPASPQPPMLTLLRRCSHSAVALKFCSAKNSAGCA